jgi:hypothetical protein
MHFQREPQGGGLVVRLAASREYYPLRSRVQIRLNATSLLGPATRA